jgi:hypothetical protein
VARINPVNQVIEALRAAFVAQPSWPETLPALAAVVGMGVFFGALALRGLRRTGQ